MTDAELRHWMRLAVRLSERGFPAPNPQVGCVIVRKGRLVGAGHHEYAGGPHAEVEALRRAGSTARGATAFVTLEPCVHQGRTPPCTRALASAGVARVVVACLDPNPIAQGGLEALRELGVSVFSGVLEAEAAAVNARWLLAMHRRRPYVALKAAVTLDGFVARADGSSKWITGPRARRVGHALRAQMGAVLVGRRTVEVDDPRLTARLAQVRRQPTKVVLDPKGALSGRERVFDGPGEVVRVVAPDRAGDLAIPALNGSFDLPLVLDKLFERGVTSLLVEGGGSTIGSFLEAGLADEVHLFVAPKAFGKGVPWHGGLKGAETGFSFAAVSRLGPDLWVMAKPNGVRTSSPEKASEEM